MDAALWLCVEGGSKAAELNSALLAQCGGLLDAYQVPAADRSVEPTRAIAEMVRFVGAAHVRLGTVFDRPLTVWRDDEKCNGRQTGNPLYRRERRVDGGGERIM